MINMLEIRIIELLLQYVPWAFTYAKQPSATLPRP